MQILEQKILCMCLLGGVSLIIGIFVWKYKKSFGLAQGGKVERRQTVITSLLLCFGGGVLFSTAMLHILPEVQEGLSAQSEKYEINWLAELIVCAGFFLVYLVEEIVHLVLHFTTHTEHVHRVFSTRKSGAEHNNHVSPREAESAVAERPETETQPPPGGEPVGEEKNQEIEETDFSKPKQDEACCQSGVECHNDMEIRAINTEAEPGNKYNPKYEVYLSRAEEVANGNKYNPKYEVRLSLTTSAMFPNYHSPDGPDSISYPGTPKNRKFSAAARQRQAADRNQLINKQGQSNKSVLKDFITVLALSFHAVFEGLAVGLETQQNDVWTLFAAIATHKFVITFCVTLEMLESKTKGWLYGMYLTTWALVSPLGIGIGILISELDPASEYHELSTHTLQGLAAGTILYVVMFEVLQREKSKEVLGILQLFAIIIGFCVMLSIELLAGHHHHEGEEEGGHKADRTHIVPLEELDHDDILHIHNNPVYSVYHLVSNLTNKV